MHSVTYQKYYGIPYNITGVEIIGESTTTKSLNARSN